MNQNAAFSTSNDTADLSLVLFASLACFPLPEPATDMRSRTYLAPSARGRACCSYRGERYTKAGIFQT
jgi:hypothetical protein